MRTRSWFFLALPVTLFLVSALIGLAIAYNPTAAWFRFGLIAGGVFVCILFARLPEQSTILRWSLALLPAAVLIYFLLTNDWTSRIGKLAWLDPLLVWLAAWQPSIAGARIDSNSLGGVLASLVPLQIAALFFSRASKRIWVAVLLVGLSILGLVSSESRGAWLAVGVIAWLWAMWWIVGRLAQENRALIWSALVALIVLAGVAVLTLTPLGATLIDSRNDRVQVWSGSLDLVSDYPFTGLGLGGFEMAYSSYVLLVHVGHTIHAHNLFLDIWLEQGLLGLLAFVGIVVTGIFSGSSSRWRIAALASVGVIVLHGFLDDAFYGYGGNAIPLLFVPLGMLIRQADAPAPQKSPRWFFPALAGATLVIVALTWVVPSSRALWLANLGALSQARAELSVYQRPQWSFQDQLRRSAAIDLNPAMADYQATLALAPANATANRRLGQIALSRGQYAEARDYLQIAFSSAPDQRATRQMLGESFAIAGDPAQAATLWQSIDLSAGQLMVRQWWYEAIGDPARALAIVQAAPKD